MKDINLHSIGFGKTKRQKGNDHFYYDYFYDYLTAFYGYSNFPLKCNLRLFPKVAYDNCVIHMVHETLKPTDVKNSYPKSNVHFDVYYENESFSDNLLETINYNNTLLELEAVVLRYLNRKYPNVLFDVNYIEVITNICESIRRDRRKLDYEMLNIYTYSDISADVLASSSNNDDLVFNFHVYRKNGVFEDYYEEALNGELYHNYEER